jgi:ribosomal protein S6
MAEMSQATASTQATTDARPVYEVGFHLLPSIAESEVGAIVDKIRALLGGAEIISQGAPERMTLSYTIERAEQGKRQKFTQSYFGWVKFAADDQSGINALEQSLREMSDIMRFILIKTTREEVKAPKRAIFGSDRLEGQTIEKAPRTAEKPAEVSEAQLDKSIDALTS